MTWPRSRTSLYAIAGVPFVDGYPTFQRTRDDAALLGVAGDEPLHPEVYPLCCVRIKAKVLGRKIDGVHKLADRYRFAGIARPVL